MDSRPPKPLTRRYTLRAEGTYINLGRMNLKKRGAKLGNFSE